MFEFELDAVSWTADAMCFAHIGDAHLFRKERERSYNRDDCLLSADELRAIDYSTVRASHRP